MKRRTELILVTLLFLVGIGLRLWDITQLPAGFSNDELAYIRITEAVREGDMAVYYQVGDGHGRAYLFGLGNALTVSLVGNGLMGYRMFSFWGGLLTLALLYRVARRLYGVPVALVALGLMSVNLRAILLARTVSAEAFVPLITLLVMLYLAKAFNLRRRIRFHTPDTLPFALLAVLFGASGYLHFSALVLGPLGALFFVHLLVTHQPISRRAWSSMVFVVVLATIVAVPYLVSTLREPNLSEPYYTLWEQRPQNVRDGIDGILGAISSVIWRGDPRATENLPDSPLLGPAMALFFLAGVAGALPRWREPAYGLLLIVLGAGLLTDAWVGPKATFSADLVALPAVYIFPGLGVLAFWRMLRGRGVQRAWQPVTLLLVVILLANLFAMRSRFFGTWRNSTDVAEAYHSSLGYLAAYLDREPDGLPISMCSASLNEPNDVGVTPRQMLRLMMHREHVRMRQSDCLGGIVFVNAGAPMRFIFMNPNDRILMPPELADWLSDAASIPVHGLPDGTVLRLDVEQRIQDAGGYWKSLSPAYYMPTEDSEPQPVDLPIQLEQNLTFAGYDPRVFEGAPVPGGDPVVLVSYWRVDGKLPPNLGIFAHVLAYPEPDQRVPVLEPWAEANTIDVIPRELRSRDVFAQVSYIWLGESVKPGPYALTIGAYTDTAAVLDYHLDVLDPTQNSQPHGDRLFLGNLRVGGD